MDEKIKILYFIKNLIFCHFGVMEEYC